MWCIDYDGASLKNSQKASKAKYTNVASREACDRRRTIPRAYLTQRQEFNKCKSANCILNARHRTALSALDRFYAQRAFGLPMADRSQVYDHHSAR
jgi:hypothetical protein